MGREEAKEFEAALDQLKKYKPLSDNYSVKALRGHFESLIVKLITSSDDQLPEQDVKREVDSWLEHLLNGVDRQMTYLSIVENLRTDDEITIGKVKFFPCSDEAVKGIHQDLFSRIDQTRFNSEQAKSQFKEHLLKYDLAVLERYKNSSIVSTSLPARDVEKGLEIALERFREAIDFLRYLELFAKHVRLRRLIALPGEISTEKKFYFVFVDDKGWSTIHRNENFPYELSDDLISRLRQPEFRYLLSILEKSSEQRLEIENRLINAIHWVSEAIQDFSETSRFLKFCICLESLLSYQDKEAFGTIVSERLAFLLEQSGRERSHVFKKTKKIYGIRSRIAHQGKPEMEEELAELSPYALAYAIYAIKEVSKLASENGWQNFEDLSKYLMNLKFGQGADEAKYLLSGD